jgi:hypothetical protein
MGKKAAAGAFLLMFFMLSCTGFPGMFQHDKGKIGFIDKTGKYAIKPAYDWIQGFKGNVAAVLVRSAQKNKDGSEISISENMGAIDIKGALIVPLKYDTVRALGEGFIMAHNSKGWMLFDDTGKNLCTGVFNQQFGEAGDGLVYYVNIGNNGRLEMGFLDKNCNKVLKSDYYNGNTKDIKFYGTKFSGGLLWAEDSRGQVLINVKGAVIARLKKGGLSLYETMPFSEGLAAVATGHKESKEEGFTNTNWGYVDTKLELVIPGIYDEAHDFSEGLACVKKGNLYGFVDASGREIIAPQFDDTGKDGFKDGLCVAAKGKKDAYFYIDKQGKKAFDKEFETAYGFSEGLAAVKYEGKWGFIDRTGAFVIKPVFSSAGSFSCGLAAVVE